jgi:hypothetical protein
MHIPQLFHSLLGRPYVEVVEARLPERAMDGFVPEQIRWRGSRRFLLGNNARAVRCFSTCTTVEGFLTSGSVIRRWTCSGMTT